MQDKRLVTSTNIANIDTAFGGHKTETFWMGYAAP